MRVDRYRRRDISTDADLQTTKRASPRRIVALKIYRETKTKLTIFFKSTKLRLQRKTSIYFNIPSD